jgi:hypothetical protein
MLKSKSDGMDACKAVVVVQIIISTDHKLHGPKLMRRLRSAFMPIPNFNRRIENGGRFETVSN